MASVTLIINTFDEDWMGAGKGEKAETVVATNRKAFHDYHIEERYEAGMALQGTEVKAIREGLVNLRDSFARVDGTEVILHNCHISPYSHGNIMNHDPLRPRKLLLHRRQINKLMGRTQQKGLTLVPLRLYFTPAGKAKIELGLGKGKHEYDRREDIKNRESRREVQRAMKASKR